MYGKYTLLHSTKGLCKPKTSICLCAELTEVDPSPFGTSSQL